MRGARFCVSVLITGCGQFDTPPIAVCGNGIVEPAASEDCDTDNGCWGPESATPCLFECGVSECPDGYVCGIDKACRQAGFELESEVRSVSATSVTWLRPHDFDHDGRAELVWIEAEPGAESGTLVVAALDSRSAEPRRWHWTGARQVPALGDVNGDGLDDVVLSVGRLDATPGDAGAVVLLNDGRGGFEPAVVADDWAQRPYGRLLAVPQDGRDELAHLRFDGLVALDDDAPIIDGDLIDPNADGDTRAIAVARGSNGSSEDSCRAPRIIADAMGSAATYARCDGETELLTALPYDTGALDSTPGFVELRDVDGDGYADALATRVDVAGDGDGDGDGDGMLPPPPLEWSVRVAYGVGDGTFHSTSPAVSGAGDNTFAPEPLVSVTGYMTQGLAVGHLDQDDVLDVLMTDGPMLSQTCGASGGGCSCGVTHACPIASSLGSKWSQGTIADVDGDRRADIVGIVDSRLVVWRASEQGFTESVIDTRGQAVLGFDLGDYDGDGSLDVLAGIIADSKAASIAVLWGDADEAELEYIAEDLLFPAAAGTSLHLRASSPITEGFSGPLLARDRIAALVADDSGEDARTGLARFIAEGDRVVAPVRARGGTVVRPWIGDFHGGQAELALALEGGGVESVVVRPSGGGVLEPIDRVTDHAWSSLAPHAEWIARARAEVVDLDGDGTDEIVWVGVTTPADDGTGTTWVRSAAPTESRWQSPGWGLSEHLSVGAGWPDASGPGQLQIVDFDADGAPDVAVMGRTWTPPNGPPGARVAAVFSGDGSGGFAAPTILDLAPHVQDLRAWAVLGTTAHGTVRAAVVGADAVTVGEVDPAVGGLVPRFDLPAPNAVEHASAADVDGDGLTDLIVGGPLGVSVYWAAEHHGPVVSEADAYDGQGGSTPDTKPPGANPPAPLTRTLYLNFDGVTLEAGPADAVDNTWPTEGTFAPFGSGPKRAATVAEVARHWEPFAVAVTDQRPAGGDYMMAVISPTGSHPNGIMWNVSGFCEDNPRGITIVNVAPNSEVPAETIAQIASSGIGVSLGLSRSSNSGDLMSSFPNAMATWLDACVAVDMVDCGTNLGCSPGEQNSYQELLAKLGPRD